jgi:CubicO group peptidase (beta-lactamase class C family)
MQTRVNKLPMVALVLATGLALSSCTTSALEDTAPAEVAAEAAAPSAGVQDGSALAGEIMALVEASQSSAPYPGVAVAVRRGNVPVVEMGFGLADIENNVAATSASVFQIGSLTKSFTALLIAQLAAEGAIDLDAPLSTYVPEYEGPAADIPIHHFMNHTSGLVNYTNLPEYPRSTRREFTREEMMDLFDDKPLDFQPGEAFLYSNSGTYLLGIIIEHVTGKTFEDALQERILTPLGLEQTYYGHWQDIVPGRVSGYAKGKEGFINAPILDDVIPFSAGALVATVGDVADYVRAVHHDQFFGLEVTTILHTQDTFPDGSVLDYARGSIGITDWEGRKKIAHAGDIDGFSAYMAYYPNDDVTIVVTTNTRDVSPSAVGLEQKIARLVFEIERPAPSAEPLTAEEISSLIGNYAAGRLRVGLSRLGVEEMNGGLAVVFGGIGSGAGSIPLIHLEGRRYVAAHDDEMEFYFSGSDGKADSLTMHWLGGAIPFSHED